MTKTILPYNIVVGLEEKERYNEVAIAVSVTFTVPDDERIGEFVDFFQDNTGKPMELTLTLETEVNNE
jgi:hypothetical protein